MAAHHRVPSGPGRQSSGLHRRFIASSSALASIAGFANLKDLPMLPLIRPTLLAGAAVLALSAQAAGTLAGFAVMPADTFAPGPTSGQFASGANGRTLPLVDKQPVQGFSAVLPGPVEGTFK